MLKLLVTALSYVLSNLDDVNQALDTHFTEREVESFRDALAKGTKDPIQDNFSPDGHEMLVRMAVHVLSDTTGSPLVLARENEVYLVAAILGPDMEDDESNDVITPRPAGTVEYQVSDGPPGYRSSSNDYYSIQAALAGLKEVTDAGGWREWAIR